MMRMAASCVRADANALDIVGRLAESLEALVHDMHCFDGRLCVELDRIRDFEEDIFHHV
jgi:hypothetical protein